VAKEYFVSGTAAESRIRRGDRGSAAEGPEKFSGIVVFEVMHGSGNSWMFFTTRLYMMSQATFMSKSLHRRRHGSVDHQVQSRAL
jgi:hypothetical protein